jgi:hypothetical protein
LLLVALPVPLLLALYVHIVAGIVAGVLLAVLVFTVISAAEGVFRAAAYKYAVGGNVGVFERSRLQSVFVAR